MKRTLTFALLLSGFLCHAQNNKHDLLTNHVWKLKSDGMIGIGIHTSIQKGSQLTFHKDGKWKSSSPWENSTEGTWSIINEGRTLHIQFSGETERDFRIAKLTNEELQCESKKLVAFYSQTWVAAQ